MVDLTKCKHGTPTPNGNNCSSGTRLMELSRTSSRLIDGLTSLEEEIKKATTLVSTRKMELQLRNGRLSIRTRQQRSRLKE
jgi:hypothetical protein